MEVGPSLLGGGGHLLVAAGAWCSWQGRGEALRTQQRENRALGASPSTLAPVPAVIIPWERDLLESFGPSQEGGGSRGVRGGLVA